MSKTLFCRRTIVSVFPCKVYADANDCNEDGKYTLETMPDVPYFNQISTILPDESLAQKVTDAIRERFGKVLNPLQNGRCIDVVSADMNKAVGLYKFLEIIG